MKYTTEKRLIHTEDDVMWAMATLRSFEAFQGFPPTYDGLRAIAVSLLRIVCDQPAHEYEDVDDVTGEPVKIKVPMVTRQDVTDWLIGEMLSSSERFPLPIQMRRCYEQRFTCADGKLSGEFGG